MRVLKTIITICLIAIAGASGPAMAAEYTDDLGRQTLGANDGWAAYGTGTTGGAAATPDQIYTVTNRQELVAALNGGSATPKIIYVQGTIDANVDDHNQPLTCGDYAARTGYSLEAYLEAYSDPATYDNPNTTGYDKPTGPLESARQAAQRNQSTRIQIHVGSNTTLVGLGDNARILGANLVLDGVDNVIIRNITFQDAYDCFPQWDPGDGSFGNWNSAYDNISLTSATHVWVDHNAFNDGDNHDSNQPLYFGRPYQVHDGLLDITKASDLVTVSWNRFTDHDKTMLIGSTDNPNPKAPTPSDRGKLRVTIHHNLFANVGQRAPRVRFGQVHVYNNYYDIPTADGYGYTWGVGVESQIFATNNSFRSHSVTPERFVRSFKGTAIYTAGTLVNGVQPANRVDVLTAYNAVNDTDLAGDVGWQPTLYEEVHPTQAVPGLVMHGAGPFKED